MNYQAVIFDLDGTVLINEHVYKDAFLEVLGSHGAKVLNSKRLHALGIGLEENWKQLQTEYGLGNVPIGQLVHETQDVYHKRLGEVIIRPGFFDLRQSLVDEGIIVALATSNNWWMVEDELEDLNLHKCFEAIVTGEEVLQRKPAPDIFLEAARKLGMGPEVCIVIEDAPAGIIAAKGARMQAVAVINDETSQEDFPKADLIIEGFEEINPKMLDALFLS